MTPTLPIRLNDAARREMPPRPVSDPRQAGLGERDDLAAQPTNSSTRVVVIDDHEMFRIGLRQLLASEGFWVTDAVSTEAAVRRLPGLRPDVVVIGLNAPGTSGAEATRLVRAAAPAAAVLMLTLTAGEEQVLEAVRAGAAGYLLKHSELPQIVAGIQAVAAGQSALSPQAARVLIDHIHAHAEREATASSAEPSALSERERQVLGLLASGCDNSQIGDVLFVSRSTVKNHVSRLFEKLGVENRVQAAAYAIRNGLADGEVSSN
jgi:DNA-binding NarL/FixJ family response regulator